MKKNYVLFFLILLCGVLSAFAQDKEHISADSLQKLSEQIDRDIKSYIYEDAIDNSHLLIDLAKRTKQPYFIAKGFNSLGHAYLDLKDSARARKNYTFGLEYAEKSENDTLLMRSYNYLGNIYSEIPSTRAKGINYYNKVIEVAKKIGDSTELLIPRANIGWTYLDTGQYDKAYPYLKQCLTVVDTLTREYSEFGTNSFKSQLYMLHGRYYSYKAKYDSAGYFFNKSLRLAVKDSLILPAAEAYHAYAEMLAKKGDYEEAYKAQEKYNEYSEAVFEGEKVKQMEIANARFNLNEYRKDLEIAKREQRYQDQIISKSKEKVVVMVLSSLVLMFILFFLNKVNRDRKKLILELKDKNKKFKGAKEEAERLSRLKTRFFSTVSHEIRTPLYGVIGLTSLLLEDKGLKKHQSDLRSLKFSADYLLALINDVLQMNKMESNEVKLENVSFNFHDLINSIVTSFDFTRVQNKNQIHVDIDRNISANLIGDPVRLSQVLMNLVGNAMKFTERGNIYITAIQKELKDSYATIYFEIKDDGPGIPESKRKVIFEEFSQLEPSNYNYQGTGLGLPIVKKLLSLFNSNIHLKSKVGEGSVFSFTIAFKEDRSKQEVKARIEDLNVDPESLSSRKILIVDDNRINQVVTKRILEKKDFQCYVAGDGKEAIKLVKENDYDLILMDVNMPGMTGMEACREIRKFNNEVPVVALTAVEVEEIREEIQIAGMNDIIVKPYDVQQFFQILYKNLTSNRISQKV
ncbi:tetratricopeptide repeat-containing hybrid sensor histidine kinase/response regulator [Christiangramia salexigens]|uniref:histidine kinase n=1 Tax=Christiangramia salexigens TaxID=1913577 RepID=A0A1L3J4G2_9FLAO|nr:response regulator [Christiangramia salexigens]APG60039.1 hybrid sensor histidine kinase/response regulator [Christiangramia salexigens]